MINRTTAKELKNLASQFKAVAVIGPRQSGKTTLVKNVFPDKVYVSLENPVIRSFAVEDPRGFLAQYPDGVILDEAQRVPHLFSYLQQILDEQNKKGLFILIGSNNFLLQESITQSLAGRIAYLNLLPFSLAEIIDLASLEVDKVLFKGMYPPLYDQVCEIEKWYANYINTYVERDVRQIKNISNLIAFERFIKLSAGRIGQLLNMNSLAVEVGVDNKTIESWISVLETSFIVFRLQPYNSNFNKRLVKMSKLYFYDTGLVCSLLGLQSSNQLATHPLRGSIFENFIILELIKSRFNAGQKMNLFFWRDRTGHEIDVLIEEHSTLIPIEIKSGQTITIDYFKGLNYWHKMTNTSGGIVIYGGKESQQRSNGIKLFPWREMPSVNEN